MWRRANAQLALLAVLAFASHVHARSGFDDALKTCQAETEQLKARIVGLERHLAEHAEEGHDVPGGPIFWRHSICALICVLFAALAAGLTMGLVSIEPMEMKIILNAEDKDMSSDFEKAKLKEDQHSARRVLPLLKEHHRLLVTLLLVNSVANEALPLFLDKMVPAWLAVTLSVTLVLIFGEIVPSAIFTGSEQLKMASMFAPLVRVLICVMTPIAWPIAKVLDVLLGHDHKGRYNFAELRAIVGIHATRPGDDQTPVVFRSHDSKGLGIITTEVPHHFDDDTVVIFTDMPDVSAQSTKLNKDSTFYYVQPCEPLNGRNGNCTFKLYTNPRREREDLLIFQKGELTSGAFVAQERHEIKIMHGVMKLTHMCASDNIKNLSEVDMLEASEEVNHDKLVQIANIGRSRLPVFSGNRHNVRGFIISKKLITVKGDEHKKVEDLNMVRPVLAPPHIAMLDLLNRFQVEGKHLALLTSHPHVVHRCWDNNETIPPDVHMMGIITLEDVIEQLIQQDIWDENDFVPKSGSAMQLLKPPRKTSQASTMSAATLRTLKSQKNVSSGSLPKLAMSAASSSASLHQPLLPAENP